MDLKNLLITLASSEGVGYMDTVADIAAKQLSPFSKVTKTDNCLMAEFGEGDYTIMLEAHMDEVAMIVTEVFDDGFLSVAPVGSIDARLLPAQPVKIYGEQTVSGTFTSVPPHIKNEDSVPSFDTCKIDTGDMAIGEKVSQGDLVLFDAPAIELKNNRISSKALDNRAGMAAVIMAAKKIATQNPKSKVVLLFPTGEELGLRGARVSAYDIPADECIVVDVSFGDCMEVPASKTAKLGSGAMIGISPVLDKNIYNKLKLLAKENDIPFTLEVMGGATSTDADVITLTRSGIPSGLISIPLRNMHTPAEVVDINDVKAVANLIAAYVEGGGLNG